MYTFKENKLQSNISEPISTQENVQVCFKDQSQNTQKQEKDHIYVCHVESEKDKSSKKLLKHNHCSEEEALETEIQNLGNSHQILNVSLLKNSGILESKRDSSKPIQSSKNGLPSKITSQFQNLIFSKQQALVATCIGTQIFCPGCIQFFQEKSDFYFLKFISQGISLLSSEAAHKKKTLVITILKMFQRSQTGCIFITDTTQTSEGTIFLGFDHINYDINHFMGELKQIIRELTYDIGQNHLTLSEFSVSLIPIFTSNYYDGPMDALDNIFMQKYAVRIQYKRNLVSCQKSKQIMSKNECLKPFNLSTMPSIQLWGKYQNKKINYQGILKSLKQANNLTKLNLVQMQMQIQNGYKQKEIKMKTYHNEVQNSYLILYHDSGYSSKIKKVNKMGKRTEVIKITRYLQVLDEDFCFSGTFKRFKIIYEAGPGSEYLVYNVKQYMRLIIEHRSPTSFIFQDQISAEIAYIILIELSVRSLQFVHRFDNNNTKNKCRNSKERQQHQLISSDCKLLQ